MFYTRQPELTGQTREQTKCGCEFSFFCKAKTFLPKAVAVLQDNVSGFTFVVKTNLIKYSKMVIVNSCSKILKIRYLRPAEFQNRD